MGRVKDRFVGIELRNDGRALLQAVVTDGSAVLPADRAPDGKAFEERMVGEAGELEACAGLGGVAADLRATGCSFPPAR
jgi:hypothetical protein